MKLLHLSDIHFWNKQQTPSTNLSVKNVELSRAAVPITTWPPDKLVKSMASSKLDPDAIVVSGDLTTRGSTVEYASVDALLRELVGWMTMIHSDEKRRVIVVPGNHDVEYEKVADESLLKKTERFRKQTYINGVVSPFSSMPFEYFEQHCVIIYAFDSTCFCGEFRQKILDEVKSDDGYVNSEEIRRLDTGYVILDVPEIKRNLNSYRNSIEDHLQRHMFDKALRIGVVHHNPFPSIEKDLGGDIDFVNAGDFLIGLQQLGFSMILHGHKHVFEATQVGKLGEANDSLIVIGAPSMSKPEGRGGAVLIQISSDWRADAKLSVQHIARNDSGSWEEARKIDATVMRDIGLTDELRAERRHLQGRMLINDEFEPCDETVPALYIRATALILAADYNSAKRIFEEAEQYLNQALALTMEGLENGLTHYKPWFGRIIRKKVKLYRDFEAAIAALKKILKLPVYENDAEMFHLLGLTFKLWGKYDEAVNAYQRALEHGGVGDCTLMDLGEVYCRCKKFDLGMKCFIEAWERYPDGLEVETQLGEFFCGGTPIGPG